MIEELYKIFQTHPIVTTDTRQIIEGCLFFALKGDKFDGNLFAQQALELGAAYAIIDNERFKTNDRFVVVDDVLTTLQNLSTHHRRQFDFPIIAITGSNGKTTTKELMAAIMSSQYNTHFTKGNYNNHIGVPLTLLKLNADHEVAIIEMGANHQGEINMLCNIAEPTHGLITNMGKSHLEGFGGFEGVKKGKSELYRWLFAHNGTIFLNQDEPHLSEYVPDESLRVVKYRRSHKPKMTSPQYEVTLEASEGFLKVGFLNSKAEIVYATTQLIGEYNFANIATAICVGKYFKVPTMKIKAALESYVPSMNRSELLKYKDATLILDAYNANPSSMKEALLNLSKMPQSYKIAILGDMRELGDDSLNEHMVIIKLAKSFNFNELVTVGSDMGKAVALLNAEGEGLHFQKTENAMEWFQGKILSPDMCVLIKGSRGMHLESLLEKSQAH